MFEEIIEEYKNCTACGYEYQWDTIKKERTTIKGDEDFIKIIGSFGYEDKNPYRCIREISLYMCSKCFTIKGNDFQYNMKQRECLKKMTEEANRKRLEKRQ
jgi:hypothetical protein